MARNWVCPFCDRAQTVTDSQLAVEGVGLPLAEHRFGNLGARVVSIACANIDCLEVYIRLELCIVNKHPNSVNSERYNFAHYASKPFEVHQIRPLTNAKHQPEFIPEGLREDYYEACLIRDKSPKSAATLARRCLQGMIRDFCKISEARLIDEIKKLRKAVDEGTAPAGVTPETIDAIDSVRSVGNIGAHMERDINVIVEVDPDEAQMLINLIELLFEEWYVARAVRTERLAKVTALSASKKAEIQAAKLALLPKSDGA